MKSFSRICLSLPLFALILPAVPAQSHWLPFGPDGGDARAFAQDPHDHNHIYLGTVSGTVFDSHDGGQNWKRLGLPGKRDDIAFDNIVVDPANASHVLVGGWVLDRPDGGLYVSNDAGKTWTANAQMKGHSIRALTVAPSDPKTMIIGALDGVFRSTDSGNTWTLISPAGSTELHEIESIAIDPRNPQTIYAGTWHLPWKTTDGGANWTNMKQGIIDDSDVFSIIVDPKNAQNVFLSACSGIYRSTNEGANFFKVQGIPSTARRTRVLMQDIQNSGTVFAGTTEGLWRTQDSGHTFLRNGDPSWIINDVNIDPQNSKRVLLATDRTGVLISNDGGVTFTPSNHGFASRQISSIVQDRTNANKLYVGVLNDKNAGGVFGSEDGGITWTQKSSGLGGADVFSLAQAPDGTFLAGTRHGIFRLAGDAWQPSGLTTALIPLESSLPPAPVAKKPAAPAHKPATAAKKPTTHPTATYRKIAFALPPRRSAMPQASTPRQASHAAPAAAKAKRSPSVSAAPVRETPPQESTTGIFAMASTDNAVYAATEEGILYSINNGMTWNRVRSATRPERELAAEGLRVITADLHTMTLSVDRGLNFRPISVPEGLTYITALAIDNLGHLWVGGREGVWFSDNDGVSWKSQPGLFVPNVSGISFDRTNSRVIVTANQPATIVFMVHTPDMKVTYQDSGWTLKAVRTVGDHMVGVTNFDGVVLQPKMVVSQEAQSQK